MRLRKIEYAFLVLAVLSVVAFGHWLQIEINRVARVRSFRDSGGDLACVGITAADIELSNLDTIWCGSVGHE